MIVDSAWAELNIGFDPIEVSEPISAHGRERIASSDDVDDLRREIIDFDSEGPPRAQLCVDRERRKSRLSGRASEAARKRPAIQENSVS